MTTIGLIGKIGAGKSTVARRLEELGAQVIDADKIAHEVLAEADVKREVVTHFGASVLGGNGELQRQVLAERVFGLTPTHAAALAILEKIVHPRVRQRINGRLDHLQAAGQATGKDAKVVLDIPLLLQAGWGDACDCLIRLECNETVRQERLKQRGWSDLQREARAAAWDRRAPGPPVPEGKITTVDTSGTLAYTLEQVDRFWSALHLGRLPG